MPLKLSFGGSKKKAAKKKKKKKKNDKPQRKSKLTLDVSSARKRRREEPDAPFDEPEFVTQVKEFLSGAVDRIKPVFSRRSSFKHPLFPTRVPHISKIRSSLTSDSRSARRKVFKNTMKFWVECCNELFSNIQALDQLREDIVLTYKEFPDASAIKTALATPNTPMSNEDFEKSVNLLIKVWQYDATVPINPEVEVPIFLFWAVYDFMNTERYRSKCPHPMGAVYVLIDLVCDFRFQTFGQFVTRLRLVFSNAVTYGEESVRGVVQIAQKYVDFIDQAVVGESIPEAIFVGPSSVDEGLQQFGTPTATMPAVENEAAKDEEDAGEPQGLGVTTRGRSRAPVVNVNRDGSYTSDFILRVEFWSERVASLLRNKAKFGIFFDEVDLSQYSDYLDVVGGKPMALRTVSEKLNTNTYLSTEEIVRDLRLIVSNCRKFNALNSALLKLGDALSRRIDSAVEKYEREFDEVVDDAASLSRKSSVIESTREVGGGRRVVSQMPEAVRQKVVVMLSCCPPNTQTRVVIAAFMCHLAGHHVDRENSQIAIRENVQRTKHII